MIASAHVAAGAVAAMVGSYTTENRLGKLAAAFVLGVISHFALDAIPHSDYVPLSRSTTLWVALFETIGAGALTAYLLSRRAIGHWRSLVVAGVAGAALPDAKFLASLLFSQNVARVVTRYGDRFHEPFHAAPPSSPMVGWALEIGCTLVLLAILATLPRKRGAA